MSPVESLKPIANKARQWRGFARRIAALSGALHRAGNLPDDILGVPRADEMLRKAASGIFDAGRAVDAAYVLAASDAIVTAGRLLADPDVAGFDKSCILQEMRSCV